jgi:hypothetical protein
MECIILTEAINITRQFYHDTVFANYKVLTVMDERGGTLNYEAFDALRDLERKCWTSCRVFKGKRFIAILPSRTDLYRTAKRTEAVASGILPYRSLSYSKTNSSCCSRYCALHPIFGSRWQRC